MAQESTYKIAIVGGGPCGCMCAAFLQDNFKVTVFDFGTPLRTILPTGGGRCNFAHAEFDFKELAKNYPRGEKFLYSVFSKFSTADTLNFFENIGIKYYIQEDNRIFPVSNDTGEVRDKFLKYLNKTEFKREKVLRINNKEHLEIVTTEGSYKFDKIIVTTGGHCGYNIAEYLGIKIVEPKPALVALKTKENFASISGVALKNVSTKISKDYVCGDVLFTHQGVSGPLIYKISSIKARDTFPYKINLNIINLENFQNLLNENPHKFIINLLSDFVPRSFAGYLLGVLNINSDTKCCNINGKTRDLIINSLENFQINVIATQKDGEVVTSGGVALDEINPATFESRKIKNLYFGGEVLDIDGFCGGFNLQNCWSNAFVIAESIKS